jgi:hypothetical protein
MTTLPNTPGTEGVETPEPAQPGLPAEDEMRGSGGKSRRDALAIVAKHSAFTAPAVLTILSLSSF